MFLSDLSIKRPIMMSMLLIVFLLFGTIAYFSMSLDLTPKVDIPYITIQTIYPGAGPKEIETQITKKIEDAVSSISKIDQMTSYSMEGVSSVIIQFEMGKNADVANQEVKDKIDKIINQLPEDAELPISEKMNLNEKPVVELILTGNLDSKELWEIADKQLKDRFSQIDGVARADISGGQEREIQVILSDRAIFENKININQLSQIIGANNLNLPGGNFQNSSQEYTVRMTGEYESLKQLSETEVPTINGYKKLSDLGRIEDSGEEVRQRTSYFNNVEKFGNSDVVLISLVKNSEGNTVDIAQAVVDAIPEIEDILPTGCDIEIITDKSIFIRSTVLDTLTTILLGILLTGLVLLIFLHDFRSTIIVALAMPMSIISAFMLMGFAGFTQNMMSLMGLSTAVGVLVSNSVVVIENIFKHKRAGKDNKTAAGVGTSEVVVAVLAATATNIAVFLPVASMSSIVGQFFKEFALTVTFATLFSLIISFTLTPMLASLILKDSNEKKKKKKTIGNRIEALLLKMENSYKGFLRTILKGKKYSYIIIAVSLGLLVLTFMFAGKVGFEFMPLLDEGDIQIQIELPVGYSLDETSATLATIESRIKQNSDVKHLMITIGKISNTDQGTNMALMSIKLIGVNERSISTENTANNLIEELSDIPNARIRISAISSIGGGEQAPITFFLQGQDEKILENYMNDILGRISDIPGITNLNTSSRSGKPEISVIPDRDKIADAGLNVIDIAMQLRGALSGLVASQYKDQGEEYNIRVMAEDESFDTPEELANLPISSGDRNYTLSQLAVIEFSDGFSKIMHVDKYKSIEFSASTAPGYPMGDITTIIEERLAEIDFLSGYKVNWGGDAKMLQETAIDMAFTLLLAIVLTYMLLAAILENLFQPILVLGTFPLALIGVIWGLIIANMTLNIISMMAIVMLLGIVVNNAILILDYFNKLRKTGMTIPEALIEACPAKLRPILMSSIAIILGMLPMAMGLGDAGREMRQPMGVVSIGGLVVSTVLTLVVIPAVYNIFSKSKKDKSVSNS